MENKLKNAQIQLKRKEGEVDDLNKIIDSAFSQPKGAKGKPGDAKADQVGEVINIRRRRRSLRS